MTFLPLRRCRLQAVRPARAGFTLVELLIAIVIFLILTFITIGAYRGVTKDDRISAASQQVKGWFEHARSMAIHAKQPRGLRLLPDANNPRLCASVAYIGGMGYDEGDLSSSLPFTDRKYLWLVPQSVPSAAVPVGSILSPGGTGSAVPARNAGDNGYATYAAWQSLLETGAVSDVAAQVHGLRIEIPRGSGVWYPIQYVGEDRDGDGAVSIDEDINGNGQNDPLLFLGRTVANVQQLLDRPLDYRLEVGPSVMPDEDATPLARGVVIDLDASWLPSIWRPVASVGSADPPAAYPQQMDIMFSPRGAFTGQLAASAGLLHFCISTIEDAEKARLNNDSSAGHTVIHPIYVTYSAGASPTGTFPFVLADPTTKQRLVSVFLTSGRVATSDLAITAGTSAPGDQNDRAGTAPLYLDCFAYAIRGLEAK